MIEMNNKIAMVNKELHDRLFDQQEWPQAEEEKKPKIYRRHQLPPQLMLKNMIRKGLTNTQTLGQSRPRTAISSFKRSTNEQKNHFQRLRSTATANIEKRPLHSNRRYEESAQNNAEFEFGNGHPQQFDQYQKILNKIKFQREQQASRKKVKLQKYGQRKFRYAWRKSNIPS